MRNLFLIILITLGSVLVNAQNLVLPLYGKAEFEKTFSKNIADVYGKVIQENVLNGLLVDDGDVIKLTDRGVDISNVVMADFLL